MIHGGYGAPGVWRQMRAATGGGSSSVGPTATGSGASVYLRIRRVGAVVTFYWAPGNAPRPTDDASTARWTPLGSVTLTWANPATGHIGVALTSHDRLAMAKGRCDKLHDHAAGAPLTLSGFLTTSQDIGIWAYPYTPGSFTEGPRHGSPRTAVHFGTDR